MISFGKKKKQKNIMYPKSQRKRTRHVLFRCYLSLSAWIFFSCSSSKNNKSKAQLGLSVFIWILHHFKVEFHPKGSSISSFSPPPLTYLAHHFFGAGGFWQVQASSSSQIATAIHQKSPPSTTFWDMPQVPEGCGTIRNVQFGSCMCSGAASCEAASGHIWLPTVNMPALGTKGR